MKRKVNAPTQPPHGMTYPYPGPESGQGISSRNVDDQDEVRLAKEYAEMIVDTVREGLLVLDLDLRVQRANESFYTLFGVSREETEGRMLFEIGNGQWNLPDLRELLELRMPKNSFFNDYEVEHDFERIGHRVMMLNARRLNHHGLILLAIEDITDRRRIEQELQVLNAELETRITKRTRDLASALSELEQEYREAQDFIFIASHDLQEPLRKMISIATRVVQEEKDILSPRGKHHLDRLQQEASRMQKFILALVDSSRVATASPTFQHAELNEIVQDAAKDLQSLIAQENAHLTIEKLPAAEVDPVQLQQLFKHLIGNALKFRREDVTPAIRIYVESGAREEDDCEKPNPCVRIAIEDNGIGFEEKYLPKLFAPFQQLHNRGKYEGTGMGLAICKKIAERHRGSITARGTPGEGSSFVVTLPLKRERSQ